MYGGAPAYQRQEVLPEGMRTPAPPPGRNSDTPREAGTHLSDTAAGDSQHPEVLVLCPQPRRPFKPFPEGNGFQASPSSPTACGRELRELLGQPGPTKSHDDSKLMESRPLSALSRPLSALSALSTSAGPSPSPEADEVASILQLLARDGGHTISSPEPPCGQLWRDLEEEATTPSCNGDGAPLSTLGSPCTGAHDVWPLAVRPSACYGSAIPPPPGLSLPSADTPAVVTPSRDSAVSPRPEAGVSNCLHADGTGLANGSSGTLSEGHPLLAAPSTWTAAPSSAPLPHRTAHTPPPRKDRKGANRAAEQPNWNTKLDRGGQRDALHLPKATVVQLSCTPTGSKMLQQKLLKAHPSVIKDILDGIETELPTLMCDTYGNHVCSAAFQACSVGQRQRMLEVASHHLHGIAINKCGTHALQALISHVCTVDEQRLMVPALLEHLHSLSCDPNGVHVIQRVLISFGGPCADMVIREVVRHLHILVHNPQGLCVIKKCISQSRSGNNQQQLLREMVGQVCSLAQGPCSNYAVQHALEEWGGEVCRPLIQALQGKLVQLSIQKFSSNVVEHALRFTPPDQRQWILEELTSPELTPILMSTVYGHYVAKRILDLAEPEQHAAFAKAISAGLAGLRNRRLRACWEYVLSGSCPEGPAEGTIEIGGPSNGGGSSTNLQPSAKAAGGRRRGPRGARRVHGAGAAATSAAPAAGVAAPAREGTLPAPR